ncbi:uncharacterized protein LOC116215004 [Punica granatum]|uniref:Uncharacterized protein LOC116214239 n=1 Tax=Punica granatum TaxID=22663 RepID=A0A218VZ60_PUNGR|nr:uncharacterized protein LOC116214239 [Punica granatum]XP_031406414.1 uncharacterized protein LOC116215004 [Punica granatum]OWM65350.1 hypothetical protein CDL15_Pgr008940 [Punica granatum]
MAQNTKHRRSLATPEAQFNPNLKIHHAKPSSAAAHAGHPTTKNMEPSFPSKAHYLPSNFFRLGTSQKVRTPSDPTGLQQKPPPTSIDIHFQAKALNLSADFASAKPTKKLAPGAEKQRRKAEEEPCKKPSNNLYESKSKPCEEESVVDIHKFESLTLGKELRRQSNEAAEMTARRSSVSSSMASGMRRRSFCGMQVELGDVFASSGVKVVSVDMPPFMQIHAVDCARKARDSLEKFSCKSLAFNLKKEFDGVYGPAWHCIVGTSFGSFVTHSVGGFMYFSMDHKMYILLFKTTVQRAD